MAGDSGTHDSRKVSAVAGMVMGVDTIDRLAVLGHGRRDKIVGHTPHRRRWYGSRDLPPTAASPGFAGFCDRFAYPRVDASGQGCLRMRPDEVRRHRRTHRERSANCTAHATSRRSLLPTRCARRGAELATAAPVTRGFLEGWYQQTGAIPLPLWPDRPVRERRSWRRPRVVPRCAVRPKPGFPQP